MNFFERNESVRSKAARGRSLDIVHDVCPAHSPEIQELAAALEPLVGRNISAAVVPNWHGFAFDAEDSFTQMVARRFGEIMLHGCALVVFEKIPKSPSAETARSRSYNCAAKDLTIGKSAQFT